ncbi:MAG TPA: ABC transporter ATP-binding protein [Anaerolineales bacterium]|nr:ABC transporter ATP-binding protein [Anaerolineales bacterium]
MTPTLQAVNLEIKYNTRQATLTAVRAANFEVERGQIVGLVGESGCGKSTIASAIMRLLPPNGQISGGELLFKGRDLRPLSEDQMRALRGREISMIFQDPMTSLNPVFSIEQQMVDAILAHPPDDRPISRNEARERAIYMLDRVGISDAAQRIQSFPHQFSGGMRQRIMIATALQSNPSLLIADEPTSALDVTLEAQIIDLIRALRDELQTSILYITHDLGVVAQLCDQVVVLYAGNVVETGDIFSVFKKPRHPYTQALLKSHPSHQTRAVRLITIRGRVPSLGELPVGCKFAARCDLAESICFAQEPQASRIEGQTVFCHAYGPHWAGKSPATLYTGYSEPGKAETSESAAQRHDQITSAEQVVQAEQVRVHFRDAAGWLGKFLGQKEGLVRAVDGIDIQVYRGETLALVGESGSGKTTLGRTILRLEQPTSGEISVESQNITGLPQAKIRPLRARMQMIFQDPISSLSPRKTVAELLLEPFQIHAVPIEGKKKVDELLAMVGLSSEQADKYPHQLSGGQARRVGIARALALNPAVLIADEPTAGLDVSVAAGILNLMKDLRERLGLTYILITHNLSIIGFIADRVAVMYLGKIVEIGETSTLFTQPRHPYTEALMSAVALPDPELRKTQKRIVLEGEIPSARNPPSGCPFHPRCRYREDRCSSEVPLLKEDSSPAHLVACHFPERVGSPRSTDAK